MQIRKTAITASKVNVSLMPESPRMDPVKTVRIATTDGTNPMEPETLELRSVENAVSEEDVVVAAAVEIEVVVVDPEAAVASGGSAISIVNPEMTRREFFFTVLNRIQKFPTFRYDTFMRLPTFQAKSEKMMTEKLRNMTILLKFCILFFAVQ